MLRRFLVTTNGNMAENRHHMPLLEGLAFQLPVFFHEGDAQGQGTCVVSEYKQDWKLLLPIYVSEPHNKGEVAQAEGNSEAGDLMWPCPVCYSSQWDGTLLNDSHKPWVTTDRKVNTYFTGSMGKLHPLRQDNGLRPCNICKHKVHNEWNHV